MVGVSLTLVGTLLTKFPGTTCTYCLGSAAASAVLFGLVYTGLPSQQRQTTGKWGLGSALGAAVLMSALYATYPEPTNARAWKGQSGLGRAAVEGADERGVEGEGEWRSGVGALLAVHLC